MTCNCNCICEQCLHDIHELLNSRKNKKIFHILHSINSNLIIIIYAQSLFLNDCIKNEAIK